MFNRNKNFLSDLKGLSQSFTECLQAHLPALTDEINVLIETRETNSAKIEYCLDTLLSLTMHGIADDLFIKLLEYYKTMDVNGARFYCVFSRVCDAGF